MAKMKTIDWISIVLLVAGGINWGVIGISRLLNMSNIDLIKLIFNSSIVGDIIYVSIGLAALYSIFSLNKLGKR